MRLACVRLVRATCVCVCSTRLSRYLAVEQILLEQQVPKLCGASKLGGESAREAIAAQVEHLQRAEQKK